MADIPVSYPRQSVPVAPPAPRDAIARRLSTTWGVLALFGLHIGLALAMDSSAMLATAHGLGAVALGAYWALQGRSMRVAWMGAYIAGSEVLWRMSGAPLPWEFGKFAVIAVFVAGMVRLRFVRLPGLALAYFFLLVPAIPFAFGEVGLNEGRQLISFNLSGPLCLFISAWFFNHVRFDAEQLRTLLLCVAAPIVGIAAVAVFSTATADNIQFFGQSNLVTSGGFGPNQVASVMGFGITALFLWVLLSQGGAKRAIALVLMLLLVAQAGLTFSRSGLGLALVSSLAASFYLVRSPRTRVMLLVASLAVVAFVQYAMIPYLEGFTEGAFSQRFTDTSSTGRTELARMDLEIWSENLLVGIGPGQATAMRESMGHHGAAHTEYTRMLAEHGMLGLLAILALLGLVIGNFLGTRGTTNRGLVAAMAVYGLAFLAINAFRLAAPALALGLTSAAFALDLRTPPAPSRVARPSRPARPHSFAR